MSNKRIVASYFVARDYIPIIVVAFEGSRRGSLNLFVYVLAANNTEDYNVMPTQNIIFLHGFLASSSFWTETVFLNLSESAKCNYRLFAVDLLGFGRSPKPNNCMYTLRDHVERIKNSVVRPFQLNSFHLVAHSMGCIIALALAAKYPNAVKSITLIAPVSTYNVD